MKHYKHKIHFYGFYFVFKLKNNWYSQKLKTWNHSEIKREDLDVLLEQGATKQKGEPAGIFAKRESVPQLRLLLGLVRPDLISKALEKASLEQRTDRWSQAGASLEPWGHHFWC